MSMITLTVDDLSERFSKDPDNEGKCPIDHRPNRPVYIKINGERVLAVADGKGHAYKVYGEGYERYSSVCKPENKYDPKEYEFEIGVSGFDF